MVQKEVRCHELQILETRCSAPMGRWWDFITKLDYDTDGTLLEDKYFCLVRGINPLGNLVPESDGQRNAWLTDAEFEAKEHRFGNLEDLQEFIDTRRTFVVEKKFTYPSGDY